MSVSSSLRRRLAFWCCYVAISALSTTPLLARCPPQDCSEVGSSCYCVDGAGCPITCEWNFWYWPCWDCTWFVEQEGTSTKYDRAGGSQCIYECCAITYTECTLDPPIPAVREGEHRG